MPADEVSGFSATTLNQTNATRSLFSWGNIVRFREYSSWSARGEKGGAGMKVAAAWQKHLRRRTGVHT